MQFRIPKYVESDPRYTKITFGHILLQLKKDLIGKDADRGVSFTYSWLANQFGHFSLGFIPTLLIYHWFFEKSGLSGGYVASIA